MLVHRKDFHPGDIKAVFRANGLGEGENDCLLATFNFFFCTTDTTRKFPF